MNTYERIKAFARLGDYLKNMPSAEMQSLTTMARNENSWFTPESVMMAISAIAGNLNEESLKNWLKNYNFFSGESKRIGVVLAGNIPLVGFHDVMCIILSGNTAIIKTSSKDQILMTFLLEKLKSIEPTIGNQIEITDRLKDFAGVIATGSDNTSRYFEYYFGKYPHIIRKNRSSVAILTGHESNDDLLSLGKDVFSYFGLGCRNVSKLFVPKEYSFDTLYSAWSHFNEIIHHHKYCNNYDYQKSILLINRDEFLDNGFVILQQSSRLVSPISVVYYEVYSDDKELETVLSTHASKIQTIVGSHRFAKVRFGDAQCPALDDYADNVDTMKFLESIS